MWLWFWKVDISHIGHHWSHGPRCPFICGWFFLNLDHLLSWEAIRNHEDVPCISRKDFCVHQSATIYWLPTLWPAHPLHIYEAIIDKEFNFCSGEKKENGTLALHSNPLESPDHRLDLLNWNLWVKVPAISTFIKLLSDFIVQPSLRNTGLD